MYVVQSKPCTHRDDRHVVLSCAVGYVCGMMGGHVGEDGWGGAGQEAALTPAHSTQAAHGACWAEGARTIVQTCGK